MKKYEGKAIAGQTSVTVDGKPLSVKTHPNNESATDVSWSDLNLGYSILVDLFGEDQAGVLCDEFVEKVIRELDDHWVLTDDAIKAFARSNSRGNFAAQQAAEGKTAPDYVFEIPQIVADPNYYLRSEIAAAKKK